MVAFGETPKLAFPHALLMLGLWAITAGSALPPANAVKLRVGILLGGTVVGLGAYFWSPLPLSMIPALALAAALGYPLAGLFIRAARLTGSTRGEAFRWTLLLVFAFAVIHPFATQGLVGGGDALHYVKQVADVIEQVRAGEFPVFVGQSSHAFNGDIHPLRTAPYLQQLGLVIDLVTGGNLNAFSVQNLAVVGSFLAAIFALYLSLIELAPSRAWLAWMFTLTFATSPAILALAFSGDMIASWMTLPFLPLLFLCLLKLSKDAPSGGWLAGAAAAAAAVWMAHAPIAVWTTLAASLIGLCWLVGPDGKSQRLVMAAGATVVFAILAGYLFASVKLLEIPPDPNLVAATTNGTIMQQLKIGWSGIFRPASETATSLVHDLQLSPASWLTIAVGLISLRRTTWTLAALLAAGAIYLLLLYPSEAIAGRLWPLLPDTLVGATEKWPMQRFYPILSVMAPFIGILGLGARWWDARLARAVLVVALAVALGWSGFEARKFVARGLGVTNSVVSSERKLLPENSTMSRYSPEYFGWLPRYFSHGVVSPHSELRLLAPDRLEPVASNLDSMPGEDSIAQLTYTSTEFGGRFGPQLTLEPRLLYRVTFAFGDPAPVGTLVMAGPSFYREYSLPTSGEERAFGAGPANVRSIIAWTTSPTPEPLDVLFLAADPTGTANVLGAVEVTPFDPALAPVEVTALVPLRMVVRTSEPAWVETPRLFVPGYQAYANDEPVKTRRSPDGLVMYAVEPGESKAELRYEGGWNLRLSFWLSLIGWGTTALIFLTGRAPAAGRLLDRILPGIGRAALAVSVFTVLLFVATQGFSAVFKSEPSEGPVSLTFTLPIGLDGKAETVAILRGQHSEEVLSFHYVNGKTLQVGIRLTDGTEILGEPFPVNYLARHSLLLSAPALGPANARSAEILVRMNERIVLQAAPTVPAPAGARLELGGEASSGGLARPKFSGRILATDRIR